MSTNNIVLLGLNLEAGVLLGDFLYRRQQGGQVLEIAGIGGNRVEQRLALVAVALIAHKKVGVQAGSALLARLPELKAMLEKTGGKLGPVVEYPSYPEAYADLANKRLDYVINVVISVNDLAKAKPKVFAKGLAVSGPGYMAWPIPKNSPQLLAYMTKFMNHMKETGKLAELQKKWFGETYDDLPTEAITSPEQFHKLAGL